MSVDNLSYLAQQQYTFTPDGAFGPEYGYQIHKLFASPRQVIPFFIRTGQISLGNATERKKFERIEFHGQGSVKVRVYVDGKWVCDGRATATENPSRARQVNIPRGTKGHAIDLEICGTGSVRAIEIDFEPMSSTS